ncbi:3'-5' exonuclease [Bacillus pinisoli]|uniref:3'-5' exonuclease n=1 Tax=Bacillus pinisoli TaxID=2901866 RepID=UPI001FF1E55D|nr:3'-5' exonuclease [Bacillus pinisoli]
MAKIKQFVFFDFEMLCSNQGMPFEDMEAIRLGAVKYNLHTEEIELFDRYIKPVNNSPLSPFCKRLTGINDDNLKDASKFDVVMFDFLAWVNGIKKSHFYSWSPSDLSRLQYDSVRHQLPTSIFKKINERYTDFQAVVTKRVTKNPCSVENALKLFELEFIGEPHNPMYDALNTFRVFQEFETNKRLTDLIMLKQFLFNGQLPEDPKKINILIKQMLREDIDLINREHHEFLKLKDSLKFLKKVKGIISKYENIVINRSGIFSIELRHDISLFIEWYRQLLCSYEEHFHYASRIVIWDEQITRGLKQLSAL